MKTFSIIFTLIVIASLFFVTSTSSVSQLQSVPEAYDHWLDVNDDGYGGIDDIVAVAEHFGFSGSPINKTALLLDLLNIVTELNLTLEVRIPRTGRVSIPAAAFQYDEQMFFDLAHDHAYIENVNAEYDVMYCAPVYLPDGVEITNVTMYWYDDDPIETLNFTMFGGIYSQLIVHLLSLSSVGFGSTSDIPSKGTAIVDNNYQYWCRVNIPPQNIDPWLQTRFYYAVIEFKYLE